MKSNEKLKTCSNLSFKNVDNEIKKRSDIIFINLFVEILKNNFNKIFYINKM